MNYYLHVCDARTDNLTKIISLVITKNKLKSVASVCLTDIRKNGCQFFKLITKMQLQTLYLKKICDNSGQVGIHGDKNKSLN